MLYTLEPLPNSRGMTTQTLRFDLSVPNALVRVLQGHREVARGYRTGTQLFLTMCAPYAPTTFQVPPAEVGDNARVAEHTAAETGLDCNPAAAVLLHEELTVAVDACASTQII